MTKLQGEIVESILEAVRLNYNAVMKTVKWFDGMTLYLEIPVIIEGIPDLIRWNYAEKRFDRVTMRFADGGTMESLFWKNAGSCDKTKRIVFELPDNFCF